jgi:hypothetical protein
MTIHDAEGTLIAERDSVERNDLHDALCLNGVDFET